MEKYIIQAFPRGYERSMNYLDENLSFSENYARAKKFDSFEDAEHALAVIAAERKDMGFSGTFQILTVFIW